MTKERQAGAVIAVDHGAKRTGFAVTDALRIASQPLDVWDAGSSRGTLLEHVAHLLEERDVTTTVVGLPVNMDGTEGARAAEVREFVRALSRRFPDLEIVTFDERLTTKAAEDLLREAGHHGEARKKRLDSWSALVILRDWLASGEPR